MWALIILSDDEHGQRRAKTSTWCWLITSPVALLWLPGVANICSERRLGKRLKWWTDWGSTEERDGGSGSTNGLCLMRANQPHNSPLGRLMNISGIGGLRVPTWIFESNVGHVLASILLERTERDLRNFEQTIHDTQRLPILPAC